MEAVQSAFGVLQVARSFLARPIQLNFLSCLHADFVGAEKAVYITLCFSFSFFFPFPLGYIVQKPGPGNDRDQRAFLLTVSK
jgi:hypothetical protein